MRYRIDGRYPIVIKYDMSIEQMIEVGMYDHIDSAYERVNFQIQQSGEVPLEALIISFDRVLDFDLAIKEIRLARRRAGEICEILSFGAQYPDVQRDFNINALGTLVEIDDKEHYPVINQYYSRKRRGLYLNACNNGKLTIGNRFLVF